jgi:hypothetical protein
MSLPFESKASALPNILLIVGAVIWLSLLKKKGFNRTMFYEKPILIYIALIVIITTLSIVKTDIIRDLSFVGKLLIPLGFILFSTRVNNFELVKKYFILSVFAAVFISTYNILVYLIGPEEFKFSKGNFINEILISERLYIGYVSVISIIFSLDIIKSNLNKSRQKLILILNVIFLFSFLLLSASRIAIISSSIVIGYFVLTNIGKRSRIKIFVSIITAVILFFFLNKNLTKRFLHLDDSYRTSLVEKIKVHEPRYDIWKCAFKVFMNEKKILFGNGYSKTKELLTSCYKDQILVKKRREWFMERKFNSHNQFLDFLLSYGAIATSVILVLIFSLFKRGQYTFLSNSLLIAVILIMFVENILQRQLGCYLFALTFVSILSVKKNIIEQDECY